MQTHYDVIIIGTGAGGGTLAYALANTGKQILLLDRGDYIPKEKANWNPQEIYIDNRYRTDERWRNARGESFQPSLYHRVGGSTKAYGAALLRMRERDFEAIAYPEGVSPAWDLKYEDFEPYYTQAEKIYKVHGNLNEDPVEPARAEPYPFSALAHEPRIKDVADRLQKIGLRPFSLPMGIDYDDQNWRDSPCIRCSTCDGYPCPTYGKADAQVCCVDPATRYPNVTLMTKAQCDRLLADTAGHRITGVETMIAGHKEIFSADVVVVACGAINSAALLLRSANSKHPNGLANSSGLVGRNLMKHNATKLYAISTTPNETIFQKTLAVNDFYFGSASTDYPLGHAHLMGKHTWEMMRPDLPKWLPKQVLEALARHSVDWWMQTEDLPTRDNHVRVDDEGKIQIHYTANNTAIHHQFKQAFKHVLREAGFIQTIDVPMPLKIMNHQVGTCKFGHHPADSVLDLNCRTHDVDNLYVVDSSFFPSISAVNPTLTIAANALRVADHLKERLNVEDTNLSVSVR